MALQQPSRNHLAYLVALNVAVFYLATLPLARNTVLPLEDRRQSDDLFLNNWFDLIHDILLATLFNI